MSEDAAAPGVGPIALLFGSALCVSCLAGLAYAGSAVLGVSLVPTVLFDGALGYAIAVLLLGGFGVLAVRAHRRERARRAEGATPNPYWLFSPGRAVASLVLGLLLVAGLAVAADQLVEALTRFRYTILWTRTVPFLAIAAGWVIHGEWNRRRLERAGPP